MMLVGPFVKPKNTVNSDFFLREFYFRKERLKTY